MLGILMGQDWGRTCAVVVSGKDLLTSFRSALEFPCTLSFSPLHQEANHKIWESNLWSLLEQKGCVGDGGGTKPGWAVVAEALCWVLGPVVFLEGQFTKHHQMWLEPAVKEWSLLVRNLVLCQYVKLHSHNRKTWLEITLRAENCAMCP